MPEVHSQNPYDNFLGYIRDMPDNIQYEYNDEENTIGKKELWRSFHNGWTHPDVYYNQRDLESAGIDAGDVFDILNIPPCQTAFSAGQKARNQSGYK